MICTTLISPNACPMRFAADMMTLTSSVTCVTGALFRTGTIWWSLASKASSPVWNAIDNAWNVRSANASMRPARRLLVAPGPAHGNRGVVKVVNFVVRHQVAAALQNKNPHRRREDQARLRSEE